MLEELHEQWHALANQLLVASLTMEMCGSAKNLKETDFQVVQQALLQAVQHLKEARQTIGHLEDQPAPPSEGVQRPPLMLIVDNSLKGKQANVC